MIDPSSPLTPDVNEFGEAIFAQVVEVMGLRHPSLLTHGLSLIFRYPIHRIASILVEVDRNTASVGWSAAIKLALDKYLSDARVRGAEGIPPGGPLLILSNHPAAYDFVVLSAAIKRDDLKILASDVPILNVLPNVSQHFIPVPYDIASRLQTVRSVIHHLGNGGSILIFPRGNVEPDPAVSPGAEQSLLGWSPSIELFLRRVPDTISVVAMASGMLSEKWYKNPLINLWKKYEQRQKVAEIFQVASQLFTGRKAKVVPFVNFSLPLSIDDLGGVAAPEGQLLESLLEQAWTLLRQHPQR